MGRPSKGTRLVQRSNGYWYVVTPGNSRGESTGTRSRQEAEHYLAVAIIEKSHADPSTGEIPLSVSDALDIYLEEHINPRKKMAGRVITDEGMEQAGIKADLLKAFFKDKAVRDIVTDDVAHKDTGYIAMRCAGKVRRTEGAPVRTCEPYTVRRDLGVLISAIEWCADVKDPRTGAVRLKREHIPHIPLPPPAPKRDRWLSLVEENALLAAVPAIDTPDPKTGEPPRLSRIHRFMVLAVEDGARKEAIEELSWFQVDFKAGYVDYRKPNASAQHNKRRARVKMTSRSRAMLDRAFKEKTGPFVLDHSGSIRTSFEAAVTRAKLEDVSPHVLRHTWATRAMQNSVPPQEVADQLADDLRTVLKNYYHHSPEYMKAAASWRDTEAEGDKNRAGEGSTVEPLKA